MQYPIHFNYLSQIMFHLTQKILRLQNQASDLSPLLLLKLQWSLVFHKEIWSPSKQKYSIANITISIMFDCLTSPGDEYAGLADWSVVVVSVWPSLKKKHIFMNICLLCCSIYIPICCCSCQDIKYNIPKSFIPVSHVSYPCLPWKTWMSPMSPRSMSPSPVSHVSPTIPVSHLRIPTMFLLLAVSFNSDRLNFNLHIYIDHFILYI